jgi:heavy metal sensor kinase
MKLRSFRTRVALLSVLLSGLVLATFATLSWVLIRGVTLERVDREIVRRASRQLAGPRPPEHWQQLDRTLRSAYRDQGPNAFMMLVKGRGGEVLSQSPHWPASLPAAALPTPHPADPSLRPPPRPPPGEPPGPEPPPPGAPPGRPPPPPLPMRPPRFSTRHAGGYRWRIGVLGNGEVTLAMGLRLDAFDAEMRRTGTALLAALPAALLLIGVGSWLVSQRALRPVRRLTWLVQRVEAQGLDQRLRAADEDVEFLPLITVFNEMMDRLEKSFLQAARFSADAAHELKTPIAILQGELEEGLQSAPPGSAEQRRYGELLEEVQRLKGIVRQLLLLSRADSGQLRPSLTRHDLSGAVESAAEDAEAMAPDLELTREISPGLYVMADPDLITQVVRNLVSNAIRYNRPQGTVRFGLKQADGEVHLTVANTGPGIPPADRDRIFERFYRGDRAHGRETDGIGLGLSLSREIMRAHGGRLVLEDSRDGWTTFLMALPAAPPQDASA